MSVAFDAQSVASGVSATSASWSHTCTGSDRCLYVAISLDGSGDANPTATYAGVAMTRLASVFAQQGLALFRLVNPATGANTVQVNWSAPFVRATVALSFVGVDQTTPDSGTASAFEVATGTSVSHNISSATGGMVVDAFSLNAGSVAGTTAGAGQTGFVSESGVAATACGMSYEAGAPTVTMSWSWSTSTNRNAHALIAINAAASGSAALTGTAAAGITEADIVAGGKTIILTVTGDTWIAN